MRLLLLIVLSAFLATLAARDAALAFWRTQGAGQAPEAIATDPMLMVRQTEQYVSSPEQFYARAGTIGSYARAALRSEPFDVIALRQLGVVAAVQRADAGRAQFAAAERISRRDLSSQLLLIEQSAQDGDLTAALAHYDRALLVYPSSGQQLYPVLAQALGDPDIRAALAKYAARPWAVDFLGRATALGGGPTDVTALMAEARKRLPPRDAERLTTDLIGQLVARGHYAAVRDLVRQMPGGASRVIDQIALSSANSDTRLAPLTWTLANEDAFETALDASEGLAIRVSSERSGMVAERVTLLAPGDYHFTQEVSYDASTPHATLTWEVRCLGDASSRPVWQQHLPIAAGNTTYRSTFTVPKACAAQSWQLVATAAETQFASTARISNLSLAKR